MKHEPTGNEQVDLARIADAAANRAREALRVLEDYCRFVLDDSFLSGELKSLRHDLAESLAPCQHFLGARDTQGDVGVNLTASGEQDRQSLQAVVQANCKRLQEALRTLEEFGKIQSPELGTTVEQLRYRSYTLEKALILGAQSRQRLAEVRLCVLVSGSACGEPGCRHRKTCLDETAGRMSAVLPRSAVYGDLMRSIDLSAGIECAA